MLTIWVILFMFNGFMTYMNYQKKSHAFAIISAFATGMSLMGIFIFL
jgi:uncharacterized membrane protein